MMQKYRVICPYCEAALLVTEDLLGQPGTCPGCQQEFLLPERESFAGTETPPTIAPATPPATPPGSSAPGDVERPFAEPPFTVPETSSRQPPLPFTPSDPVVPPVPGGAVRRTGRHKPVRIENRPALRMLSGLLKILAALQVIGGCVLLIGLVVLSSRSPMPPELVLTIVGVALSIGLSAIPMLAFSELILVFLAQEEMLRHLVNHQREQDAAA